MAPSSWTSALDGGQWSVVSFTSLLRYPSGKSPRMRLFGPQIRFEPYRVKKKNSFLVGKKKAGRPPCSPSTYRPGYRSSQL